MAHGFFSIFLDGTAPLVEIRSNKVQSSVDRLRRRRKTTSYIVTARLS
jgi:hypothetical protein